MELDVNNVLRSDTKVRHYRHTDIHILYTDTHILIADTVLYAGAISVAWYFPLLRLSSSWVTFMLTVPTDPHCCRWFQQGSEN